MLQSKFLTQQLLCSLVGNLGSRCSSSIGGSAQGKMSFANISILSCVAPCDKSTYPQKCWEVGPPDGLLRGNECPSDSFTRTYCMWVGWMKCTGHKTGKAVTVVSTLPGFYFSLTFFSCYMWKFWFLLQSNCNSFVGGTDDPILTENLKKLPLWYYLFLHAEIFPLIIQIFSNHWFSSSLCLALIKCISFCGLPFTGPVISAVCKA